MNERHVENSLNASVIRLRYEVADLQAEVERLRAHVGLEPLPNRPIVPAPDPGDNLRYGQFGY